MAIVKKYAARVIKADKKADGVYSVELKSEGKPFLYYPGQFLHLALDEYEPGSAWPESRCFSMQTPPGIEFLKITYAVKGRFTRRMEVELNPGRRVTLKLPYGELFTQDHSKVNSVFIAGGTGITPFLSLFNDLSFSEYQNPVLFAGFRKRELNFCKEPLRKAMRINPTFSIRYYYEDENGLIAPEEISALHPASVFISGPPAMISFFKLALKERGMDPMNIKTDDWE